MWEGLLFCEQLGLGVGQLGCELANARRLLCSLRSLRLSQLGYMPAIHTWGGAKTGTTLPSWAVSVAHSQNTSTAPEAPYFLLERHHPLLQAACLQLECGDRLLCSNRVSEPVKRDQGGRRGICAFPKVSALESVVGSREQRLSATRSSFLCGNRHRSTLLHATIL